MGIAETVRRHNRIICDTAPVIYFIEEHSIYGKVSEELFGVLKDDKAPLFFSSVITLTEVLTHPIRQSRNDLVDKYIQFLINARNFRICSIDSVVAQKAAELRALYSLKTPDALQIATGIENNASLFVTNDRVKKCLRT